jgi:hypothetical protein
MRTNQVFSELLTESREFYQKIGEIYCPALKASVIFNSNGFHHLRYNNSRVNRTKTEQRNKLAYIPQAVDILKITTTIQEYRETMEPLGTPDSKGFRPMIRVAYFAFWSVMNIKSKIRVKCIVKYIENSGKYSFWSVMPYWTEKIVNGQTIRYVASRNIADE